MYLLLRLTRPCVDILNLPSHYLPSKIWYSGNLSSYFHCLLSKCKSKSKSKSKYKSKCKLIEECAHIVPLALRQNSTRPPLLILVSLQHTNLPVLLIPEQKLHRDSDVCYVCKYNCWQLNCFSSTHLCPYPNPNPKVVLLPSPGTYCIYTDLWISKPKSDSTALGDMLKGNTWPMVSYHTSTYLVEGIRGKIGRKSLYDGENYGHAFPVISGAFL